MKILVYGMQSSGASLFTAFLAQKAGSLAIIDVWANFEAPELTNVDAGDIIVKCIVTKKIPLEAHLRKLKPDIKILVLRDPCHNYSSLKNKPWANVPDSIDKKFTALEEIFAKREQFDLIILYEDFLLRPFKVLKAINKIGFRAEKHFFKFKRSKKEILDFNIRHSQWCKSFYRKRWGIGGIGRWKADPLVLFKWKGTKEKDHVRKLCPNVCGYFEKNIRSNVKYFAFFLLFLILRPIKALKARMRMT